LNQNRNSCEFGFNFFIGPAPHIILSLCFSIAAMPWPLAPASLLCSLLP
jgi:hypothetical protein